jgi:hypothetical protein
MTILTKHFGRWMALGLCLLVWLTVILYFNRHPLKPPAPPTKPASQVTLIQNHECLQDVSPAARFVVDCALEKQVAAHSYMTALVSLDRMPRTIMVSDSLGMKWRSVTKPISSGGPDPVIEQLWFACDSGKGGKDILTVTVNMKEKQDNRPLISTWISEGEWLLPLINRHECDNVMEEYSKKAQP